MDCYEAAVIGAGPAGLFASRELALRGIETILLEEGREMASRFCPMYVKPALCHGCVPCHEVSGVGGAGGFSDGKLCLGPVGVDQNLVGNVWPAETDYVVDVFRHVLGGAFPPVEDETSLYASSGVTQETSPVALLGTSSARAAFERMYDNLSIEKRTRTRVSAVTYEDGSFCLRTAHRTIRSRFVVLATGKSDFSLRPNVINSMGLCLEGNSPALGIRIEAPNENFAYLKSMGPNPKIKRHYPDGSYVKTHCFAYGGEVMAYLCGPHFLVDGRADVKPTLCASINVLYVPAREREMRGVQEVLDNVSASYPRNVIFQDVFSFLGRIQNVPFPSPCRGGVVGDLRNFYPNALRNPLCDLLKTLESDWRVELSRGAVHGPVAEWITPKLSLAETMESSFPGLFIAGDTSGATQGIVAAAITGVRAGKEIARRIRER